MNKIRQLISDATNAFSRLAPRERRLVGITTLAALVFIIGLSALTISRSVAKSEARLKSKLTQLEEVSRLTSGFRAQQDQQRALEDKLKANQVRLFSYIDELAKKQTIDIGGLNDKGSQPVGGENSKVAEASVEVTHTKISLDKLLKFLAEVEATQGLVKVTRLQIRPRGEEPVLDAWLTISTYNLT